MKRYCNFFAMLLSFIFLLSLSINSAFGLANPASVNCVKQGGKSILDQSIGYCVFLDGTYCEEWAYFRGKCKKGMKKWNVKVTQHDKTKT